MDTPVPVERLRVGDELFHPIVDGWCVVRAIAAFDNLGCFRVMLSDGTRIDFSGGEFVTVSHSPYICTKCEQESAGFQEQDLCLCGAIAWAAAGWVCQLCGHAQMARGECPCGAENGWVWGMLPHATAPAQRPTMLPNQAELSLEQRILAAVQARDLPSANAVVKQLGGRRQNVCATVKAMLGDERLRLVDGYLRPGR